MGIYLLHLLKQKLDAFTDLVYMCGLEKVPCILIFLFNEMFLPCRVTTFRGQNMVKHGGHWGISFKFID